MILFGEVIQKFSCNMKTSLGQVILRLQHMLLQTFSAGHCKAVIEQNRIIEDNQSNQSLLQNFDMHYHVIQVLVHPKVLNNEHKVETWQVYYTRSAEGIYELLIICILQENGSDHRHVDNCDDCVTNLLFKSLQIFLESLKLKNHRISLSTKKQQVITPRVLQYNSQS